ncbi:MAG: hypothetical protein HDQ88_12075 [Clostridia bacterium]|nr:hypothetical protein [Clostridia bacterium]
MSDVTICIITVVVNIIVMLVSAYLLHDVKGVLNDITKMLEELKDDDPRTER